jgi:dihydroorotase
MELFEARPLDEKRITAEVCVHHLLFDDTDYADKGTLIKCNPAIKTPADRDALRQALREGRIDVVATDHAPHTLEEKQSSYFMAPAGLPLVQHALPMLLELYHDQQISLETLVERACHAPARLFDIADRGYLREGYWADLVLVDLHNSTLVESGDLLYKCGWSPLEGEQLRSSVDTTIVNGNIVYQQGQLHPEPCGQRLQFQR